MPIICDGNNWVNGNPKPVTLVRIVVTRNSAVQPGAGREPSSPNKTTRPETIPTRLMMTCKMVNVGRLRPSIMTRSPQLETGRMLRLPTADGHTRQRPFALPVASQRVQRRLRLDGEPRRAIARDRESGREPRDGCY